MLKRIFVSWDLFGALVVSVCAAVALPQTVDSGFAKDLYGVGISVLSIVFSVFFAALALVMTASDDDFVVFLQEAGDYTVLLVSFQVSLAVLFVGLLVSIGLYAFSAYSVSNAGGRSVAQSTWLLTTFAFAFIYGLLAAAVASQDSLRYCRFRSRFTESKCHRTTAKKSAGT